MKEILWIYDENSNYYPPASSLVVNYCDQLRESGIDVDTPNHEPYVLIRTDIRDEMDDRESVMILNWQPVLFKKEHL